MEGIEQLNIQLQFKLYLARLGIKDLAKDSEQYKQLEMSFFAGCSQLLFLFENVIADIEDEDRAMLHMEDLLLQCDQFWKSKQ